MEVDGDAEVGGWGDVQLVSGEGEGIKAQRRDVVAFIADIVLLPKAIRHIEPKVCIVCSGTASPVQSPFFISSTHTGADGVVNE